MTVSYELISRRIRELRMKRGMSQAQLADLVGSTTPYISHIEAGRKKPSLEMLILISDALGSSVDSLVHKNADGATGSAMYREVEAILDGCDLYDQHVLIQMMRAMKQILQEERAMLDRHSNL